MAVTPWPRMKAAAEETTDRRSRRRRTELPAGVSHRDRRRQLGSPGGGRPSSRGGGREGGRSLAWPRVAASRRCCCRPRSPVATPVDPRLDQPMTAPVGSRLDPPHDVLAAKNDME
nr:unnamed protein product [Digitaria exilis]